MGKNNKEYVVVPMGDPAGIGPEIVVKSFSKNDIFKDANILVVGDANVLERANEICKTNLTINIINDVSEGKYENGTLDVVDLNLININEFKFGEVSAQCGLASYKYIEKAGELCMDGQAVAMATTTINKESLAAAGIKELGHTNILEKMTKVHDPLTMFQVQDLRVTFYSKHVSLREACDLISKEGIKEYVLDEPADLNNLPVTDKMGSTAFIILTSQVYMINSKGEWKEV